MIRSSRCAAPADALRALESEATEFGRSPAVRERPTGPGLEPHTSCGAPFAAQIGREIDANARFARELGLKAD